LFDEIILYYDARSKNNKLQVKICLLLVTQKTSLKEQACLKHRKTKSSKVLNVSFSREWLENLWHFGALRRLCWCINSEYSRTKLLIPFSDWNYPEKICMFLPNAGI